MILFLDDWKRYPNAIAVTETTNKSFLRYSLLLKEMGIKNHAFPLALFNRNLIGIDPFDTNLSTEQMMMIGIECKLNPFFYFREVARVPPVSGNHAVSLEANRANMALFWSFFNHIFTILIQPRQTGKSVSTDVLMTLLLNVLCANTQINLLTKDDSLRSANIQRLKDIESELPFYLKQRTRDDTNNTEELSIKALNNRYKAHVPQKSQKMAYNVGRGLTSPIFHIDEGPFQSNIAISLPTALSAGTAAREQAAANNQPYGTIFTTTAGKKDDRDGRYCYGIVSEAAEWTEKFLDCKNHEELEQVIRRNSRTSKETPRGVFAVNITMNHRQLGKSDEWLRKAIEGAKVHGEDADRDFGNIWTSGTQTHPLPTTVLETIRSSQEAENHTTISTVGGYITKWFIPELGKEAYLKNNKFVMSMDTSDAAGGDDISLILQDIKTGATVATGKYNETNLIVLAEWICSWVIDYENILLCIERRSSGATILDYLLLMLPVKGIDPFKRLFNRIVNDAEEFPDRFKEIQIPMGRRSADIYVKYKKAFGFSTSGTGLTSRTELYSTTLQNAAKRIGNKVKDLSTINQIAGLTTINGRIDHQQGEHDDMVIAFLLNFWMMTNAKNLYFYGIESREVLIHAVQKKELSRDEMIQNYEQEQLRLEIENVAEALRNEKDEYITHKLETRLKWLDSQLIFQNEEKISVDDLINSVRTEKRRNRTFNQNKISSMYDNYNNINAYHAYRDPMKVFG